jgi:hypothetical protein
MMNAIQNRTLRMFWYLDRVNNDNRWKESSDGEKTTLKDAEKEDALDEEDEPTWTTTPSAPPA